MKKNIIYLLIAIVCLSSCKKEEGGDEVNSNSFTSFRVKKITGKNGAWGDYTFEFFYNGSANTLDSAFRYDSEGRRQGDVTKSSGENNMITYNINDLVNSIDADSVKRMDAVLKFKYGEGNYSLFDSIPRIGRALYSATSSVIDGDVKGTYTYHKQRQATGTGAKFDNTYTILKKETITYEYDSNGNILNCRAFEDVYIDGNTEKYTRKVYKSEFVFEGNRVIANNIYFADNNTSNTWDLVSGRKYSYSGANLQSIQGEGFNVSYTYSGAKLSLVTDGATKYTIDENGCVKRVEYQNGDYMDMTYEAGVGNFDVFAKLEYLQVAIPTIR